jgi:hypothetical protein
MSGFVVVVAMCRERLMCKLTVFARRLQLPANALLAMYFRV